MYITILLTVIIVIITFLFFNEKKKNENLRKEIKRLRQELKALRNQREEERIKEIQEVITITEGLSKIEDGKLYLTSEALKKIRGEWKLSRDELEKRLEEIGLKRQSRTRKSINGEIQYAYTYILEGKEKQGKNRN
jgi:predicted transcriptional regulator